MKTLEAEIQRVRENYEEEREKIWALAKEKEVLENQLTVMKVEKDSSSDENRRTKEEIKKYMAKVKELQNEKVKWMEEFYRLNNSINFNQAKFEAMEKNEESMKRISEELKRKITVEKNQNVKIYREIETLEGKVKTQDKDMEILKAKLRELERENETLKQ